ncbi:MAG: nucleotide exchange factor GrpE [Candidatus Omnitrophica bacterium]|nr:nucleotide exchange factor GrpE [Candidatus Omnitrophota bacterium]
MNNSHGKNDKKAEEDIITVPKSEYDVLKAKADERDLYYDKYLRLQAEFDNAKKRFEKDKGDLLRYANDGFLLEFMPILDNLEAAERHIKEAKDFKAVQEGVDIIQVQIQRFLKDIGVERVKTVGEKFDPHVHDAIEVVETADGDDGMVVQELKPGYRLNGRLLRPASVKISKKK